MPVESATYISDLNASNPPGTDGLAQADEHLRLIKAAIKATFPNVNGAVTVTDEQLNAIITGVADDSITDAKLRNSTALSVIGRSANSTGDPADIAGTDGQVLRVSGTTLGFGTIVAAGIASDAVITAKILDSNVTTAKIADDNVTNAKLANMAQNTIKGRITASTGDPEDLTATQATSILNAVVGDSGSGGTKGLVPAPAAGDAAASKFLKADGTWASPGSANKIAQVVNTQTGAVATGSTSIPYDDTIPQNTEGTQFMTLAITPTNSSSKLKIEVVFYGTADATSGRPLIAALFQDSTANALAAGTENINSTSSAELIAFTHYMTAGTTSATTFKVRAGSAGGNSITFNGSGGNRKLGGVYASSITITEILP